MRFEQYMALRYLTGVRGEGEGAGFLRFIMIVATGGVAVGVAALVLSLSIVRGFSKEIEAKIIGFGAHVQVESFQDAPLRQAAERESMLRQMPEVQSVAPIVQEFVLLRKSSDDIDGVVLSGMDSLSSYLAGSIVEGSAELGMESGGHASVVIGSSLAASMRLNVGDPVTVFSNRRGNGLSGASGFHPKIRQFVVGGIYESSLQNFDELYIFTSLNEARSTLGYSPDEVTRFDVTLNEINDAKEVALRIEDALGFPVMARTVFEVWRGLFAWVNLQQSIIPVVISVIVIVASFNIIGTLLMIILEKAREIGVLASMGAASVRLRRLFLWLGLFIGTVGVIVGESIALALALIQQRYKVIPLPAKAYYMSYAPVDLNAMDFVIVAVVALVLCGLASYLPARVGARLDPIRVIRFR